MGCKRGMADLPCLTEANLVPEGKDAPDRPCELTIMKRPLMYIATQLENLPRKSQRDFRRYMPIAYLLYKRAYKAAVHP